MQVIFWLTLLFIIYTYLGYPVLLYLWSIILPKKVMKEIPKVKPNVSVVIVARNEGQNIEARIRDLIDQDYQKDKLEIIVVSDGSKDNTNSIIEQLARNLNNQRRDQNKLLRCCCYTQSRGKPYGINVGVANAKGEIVVFTDCRQRFSKDAIKQLVANFSDDKIGCVSGELIFKESPGSSIKKEVGAYWKFEKYIRKLESKTGSVVGATGAIYAIRTKLYIPLPEQTLLDDVLTPLNIYTQGYRVIFDSDAVAYDVVSDDFAQEKGRKIRTLAGNWQLLIFRPALVFPSHSSLWFKLLSHKIFRLFIPYCSITLLAMSLYLWNPLSISVVIVFVLFVVLAFLPSLHVELGILSKLTRLCRSVFFLNYFAFLAPFRLIMAPNKLWK